MDSQHDYNINLDEKYGFLKLIDIQEIVDSCKEKWFNQTLCRVNDCVVRLGIVKGEFHWHKHDNEDEFFYVIDGKLLLDLEGKTIELFPNQGFTVPKGVLHKTRAEERTVMMMIEGAGVKPTGDE